MEGEGKGEGSVRNVQYTGMTLGVECSECHGRVCCCETHTSERPWEIEGEAMTRQKPLILLSSMRCLRLCLAATVSATLSEYLPSRIEYTITRPLPGREEEGGCEGGVMYSVCVRCVNV